MIQVDEFTQGKALLVSAETLGCLALVISYLADLQRSLAENGSITKESHESLLEKLKDLSTQIKSTSSELLELRRDG